ncbi:signal peptidase I [Roseiconus nitratireducens]|uniref:Signal peptidase I n=1 Tax=Roseiconus nitratireducens TaxID=2605748 RepID=A0A5M6CWL3_9BACT|nr:signal peptidase I [Roseiconus nitratireducens]KAA5539608.1 signal peptidase I [Roseiconus nitratireducens]
MKSHRPAPTRFSRFAAVAVCLAVALCTVLCVAAGYRIGFRVGHGGAGRGPQPDRMVFQVKGASMTPTLVEGDLCLVQPPASALAIGDVVAIDWAGKARIKRIAALAGDRLEVREGHLLVNQQRLEDLLAARDDSAFPLRPALVPVASGPTDWRRPHPTSPWLVFCYANPHSGGHPTAVMDDYPSNTDVHRRLRPVDRLVLEVTPEADGRWPSASDEGRVAFFQSGNLAVAPIPISIGSRRISQRAARESTRNDGSDLEAGALSISRPIALRVSPQVASELQLRVWREIEYRADTASSTVAYPLTVPEGKMFVVGDNVPVSVDSRQWGNIPTNAVTGQAVCTIDPRE